MSASDDNIVLFRRAPAELNRRNLERFARTLRGEVAKGAGFTCLITGDSELRRLNRGFLGKDYPTDVLSFPVVGQVGPVGQAVSPAVGQLGEMAISAARARRQAAAFGHSFEDELCILMLHGLLHLLGMDHETDRGQMKRAESRWRQRLALPQGLVGRALGLRRPPRPPGCSSRLPA
jgi:probable rRNA maturation factor